MVERKGSVRRVHGLTTTGPLQEAHIFGARSFRNFLQRGDDPRLRWARIYLATVLADTLKPNLASSAWIRF
jgi:hypothetical protein